jgi:ribosomal 30S subunit maturation factor RimM
MSESEPVADAMLTVGKITGCYGIKGWVKIHPYTDPQENFLGFGQWMLMRRSGLEPIEFDAGRRQGRGLVAHIAGVDDRTLALPVFNAVVINAQALFLAASDRIEETNPLDEASVARIAAVSDCHVVKGALFGATTSKTNCYHFT